MTSAIETSNEAWPVAKNKMVTAIVASLLGWSLDLFDLFILLYVAPVIGKLFFPSASRPCRSRPSTPPSR